MEPTSEERFQLHAENIRLALAKITAHMEYWQKFPDGDEYKSGPHTWADTASAGHIETLLKEVLDFCGVEN